MEKKFTQKDITYMARAIELAKKGVGFVNPNPLVGAVIVKDDKIIGEGYHQKFGGPHAEINAINSASSPLSGATIYVTLEPCSHFGKTPPCSLALIEAGFKRVVIAMKDPNPLVSGRGIKMMEEKGLQIDSGLLEKEAIDINQVFIKYITKKRPFVVMKTAMSLDGKIATHTGDSKWISGSESRKLVHQMRHKYMGIMVCVNTVITDNPELTCRIENKNTCNPIRIILDTNLRTPADSKICDTSNARTIIVTGNIDSDKASLLQSKGVELLKTELKNDQIDLDHLCYDLGKMGIDSILLEGGATVNFSAIQAKIVDRIESFIAPKFIGGNHAPGPVGGKGFEYISEVSELKIISQQQVGDDILISASIK
jgi:diaminohydroxyphosphoribosylaminopyrimidine deaminase/5-amino-6-(5-phosphoribosylamino)uracil reductase